LRKRNKQYAPYGDIIRMKVNDMAIGAYLKGLRKKAGLTIRDVVEMTGEEIDKTTISRIERDERGLSLKAAFFFSEIYGADLDDMAK